MDYDALEKRLREPPFGTETSERNLMMAAADAIADLRARNEALWEALTDHNNALRSACAVADRNGADTNWLTLRGQIYWVLAEHHELTNEAREALAANIATAKLANDYSHFESTIEPGRWYVAKGSTAIFATEIGASGEREAELVARLLNALAANREPQKEADA